MVESMEKIIYEILKTETKSGYLHDFHDFEELAISEKHPDMVDAYLHGLAQQMAKKIRRMK